MKLSVQFASHIRQVYFGGNWTASSLKEITEELSLKEATTRIENLNTIAVLVYHLHYYLRIQLKVLQGAPLKGSDAESFKATPFNTEREWQDFMKQIFKEAEQFADLIENLPENRWQESFTDDKYGSYFRNIQGFLEHTHYHLGQLVILRKMIANKTDI
ncbi:DinB family protein [Robertkochia aurantiaca]|uniref:DinB family protein n=1 Tax=Robertkochia aurantiaca TaxID=2873700 RepID=UPI001CCBB947|nr:DinB family protein [Robertkochia sp. 3YJGBD-33]